MKKLNKTILKGIFLSIVGIFSFLFDISILCILSLSILSIYIFFYNKETINIGLVKLYCISSLLLLFFTIGKNSLSSNSILISIVLWILLNMYGIYSVPKIQEQKNI